MSVTVEELIAELRAYAAHGYAKATVYVQSEGFDLVDMDADGELKTFGSVLATGVDEAGYGTGEPMYLVIGREEPEEAKRRILESSPMWVDPAKTKED